MRRLNAPLPARAGLLACLSVLLPCAGPTQADESGAVREKTLLEAPFASPGGDTLTATEVELAPGTTSPPHRHSGYLYVYVLSGTIRSQLDDGPPKTYRAGDSWVEPPGTLHSRSENPSANEPARLLVVSVAPAGAPLTTFER